MQSRVREGGKIAIRSDGNIGADIVRNISESVQVGDDFLSTTVIKAKEVKSEVENMVPRNTDYRIVTEQKKSFMANVIVVNPLEKEIENTRKDLEQLKIDLNNYYSKKKKRH